MPTEDPASSCRVRHPTTARAGGIDRRALSAWSDLDAYVLLGEPGSGKTKAFEAEARRGGAAKAFADDLPLNAADLAALLCERLEELQRDLRGREANQIDQFWHDAVNGQRQPRHENTCHDRLFSLLRQPLLMRGIGLDTEPQHANGTRADLGVFQVVQNKTVRAPVEIECENHRAL